MEAAAVRTTGSGRETCSRSISGMNFSERPHGDEAWRGIKPELHVAYEDDNILIADKRAGMLVHSDETGDENTLINHIKAYLL